MKALLHEHRQIQFAVTYFEAVTMRKASAVRMLTIYLLLSVFFLNLQNAWADQSSTLNLLWPAPQSSEELVQQSSQERSEPFIKRVGEVYLGSMDTFQGQLAASTDDSARLISFKGMQILMSFFPEREISVIADSEYRSVSNAISIGGHEAEGDISTFLMTITREKYLITYQDIGNALTYRVVGDAESGIGRVVEIDLKKIPPMYDSAPVVPPTD